MYIFKAVYVLFILSSLSSQAEVGETDLNELSEQQNAVKIHKCCERSDLKVDSKCRSAEMYNQSVWEPKFKDEEGKEINVKYFDYVLGIPDCGTTQPRAIYYLGDSEDELNLLPDGRLRHLIHHEHKPDTISEELVPFQSNIYSIHDTIAIPEKREPNSYIHIQGKYCIDKIFMTRSNKTGEYAMVCVPEVKINWSDSDFILKKILNPLFHALAMFLYLLVAIIYFVLPTLRDLAGNIITTINICLIVNQAADLVRVFTEFSNHVSFFLVVAVDIFVSFLGYERVEWRDSMMLAIIVVNNFAFCDCTDTAVCISLLSAFFWLNSFGFYIWKTFKSRNVFLRVTDVRKYCYYSCVVWSSTIVMGAMALSAHWLLDTNPTSFRNNMQRQTSFFTDDMDQETIGWLGIAIFFTPVAFTIVVNIFFYVTTMKVIKRINIYGRIHHKLKGCFDLFIQMFLIMSIAWVFLLLSWLKYDGLIYAHIVVNLLQAILIFYVCVLRQSHVSYLIRKTCCYAEPVPTGEWGDEMAHMNGNNYYN